MLAHRHAAFGRRSETRDPLLKHDLDPLAPQVREQALRGLRIQGPLHQPVGGVIDGDCVARLVQIRRQFEPDETTAHDGPMKGGPAGRRDSVAQSAHGLHVLEPIEHEEVLTSARPGGRHNGFGASGEHQVVIVDLLAATVRVLDLQLPCRPRDGQRLHPCAHLDPRAGQRREGLDHDSSGVVVLAVGLRKRRARVETQRVARDQRDGGVGSLAPKLFGKPDARHARADDDDLHSESSSKADLSMPQSGQRQLSGSASKGVPGAMPASGSPTAGS